MMTQYLTFHQKSLEKDSKIILVIFGKMGITQKKHWLQERPIQNYQKCSESIKIWRFITLNRPIHMKEIGSGHLLITSPTNFSDIAILIKLNFE